MVKPKRDLEQTFTPRTSAPSIREILTPEPTENLKHLTVQISETLRRDGKRAALDQGISVRELVTAALTTYLTQ